jgi:hypothetical protein
MNKTLLREALRLSMSKNTPEHHPCFYNKSHHFSFVVQCGKIVEMGVNKNFDPYIRFGYPDYAKIHSECDAFRKARGIMDFSKRWDMVNVNLSRKGEMKISKPCPCCTNFLKIMGCTSVVFTTSAGAFAYMNLKDEV